MDMLCKDSGDWLPASQCNVESPSAADQSQKKLRSDKESGVFEVIRKTFMAFWENRLDCELWLLMCVSACFHVTVPESLVRRRVVFTATEEELISFIYNVIFPSALIRLANANTTSSTVRPTGPDTISWCFSSGVTAATVYGCQHTPKSYLCRRGQWGAEQKMLCWQQSMRLCVKIKVGDSKAEVMRATTGWGMEEEGERMDWK